MRHQQEDGFVLLLAMFVVATTLTLHTVSLSRAVTELRAATLSVQKFQAFHAADGAFDDALTALRDDPELELPYTCPALPGPPQGVASCTIADQGDGTLLVTAEGSVGSSTERIEVLFTTTPSVFTRAIVVRKTLKLDEVLVDSYDSDLGGYNGVLVPPDPAYGSLNKSRPSPWDDSWKANLATNGTSMDLKDTIVFGTLTLRQGKKKNEVKMEGSTTVYGGPPLLITSPLPMAPILIPPGLCTGQSLEHSEILAPGIYCYKKLELTHAETVQTQGHVTIYVTEELKVEKGAALVGRQGTSETPAALAINYAGKKAAVFDQAQVVGTLYAPRAEVELKKTELFGAVMAKKVTAKETRIHYDEDLRREPTGGGPPQLVIRAWRQP